MILIKKNVCYDVVFICINEYKQSLSNNIQSKQRSKKQSRKNIFGICRECKQVNYDKLLVYYNLNTLAQHREVVKNMLRVWVENIWVYHSWWDVIILFLLQYLWDNISLWIKNWMTRFLSQAGKEVFIKSVLQSLPTYAMSFFLLPNGLCNGMNGFIRKY